MHVKYIRHLWRMREERGILRHDQREEMYCVKAGSLWSL